MNYIETNVEGIIIREFNDGGIDFYDDREDGTFLQGSFNSDGSSFSLLGGFSFEIIHSLPEGLWRFFTDDGAHLVLESDERHEYAVDFNPDERGGVIVSISTYPESGQLDLIKNDYEGFYHSWLVVEGEGKVEVLTVT